MASGKVFHLTRYSFAFVNLKPLLPGHVLVSPLRPAARLHELPAEEASDLFLTVQRVGALVERLFGAVALNIAVQDGREAGQSVPHLHVHLIPRRAGDLDACEGGSDAVYAMLEGDDGDVGKHLRERASRDGDGNGDGAGGGGGAGDGYDGPRPKFPKVDEAARKPRTEEEMNKEAEWLRREMESSRL